jgi:hypothetical protein
LTLIGHFWPLSVADFWGTCTRGTLELPTPIYTITLSTLLVTYYLVEEMAKKVASWGLSSNRFVLEGGESTCFCLCWHLGRYSLMACCRGYTFSGLELVRLVQS